MTRILHVLDHSLPLHSGYTFRTRAILRAQMSRGFDVRGITGRRHEVAGAVCGLAEEVVDGLRFHRTPGPAATGNALVREWRDIRAHANAIETLVQDWRPDVIHAHSPVLNALAAQRVARRHGIPIIYEIRAFWEDAAVGNGTGTEGSLRYWLTRWLETRAVRAADAVAVICQGLRTDLVARGIDADKIIVSPNGVDLGQFGTPVPRDPALTAKMGLEGADVVGFIGSFYDYEGLDDLIAAMPVLVAQRRHTKLLLVGGGPCEDALRMQAAASPVRDHIIFVGRVPHDQVEHYYSQIDILAYPRKAMRLTDLVTPLKPLEAMAQGRLVAASSVGGHRELIEHGVTGTLFPPDDPLAMANALSDLFSRRDLWDERRIAARQFVERERNWSSNILRYEPVYQRLIDAPKRRVARSHDGTVNRMPGAGYGRRRKRAMMVSTLAGAGAALAVFSMPVGLMEAIVTSLGLSEAIPAAAPPLGINARLLMAGFVALMAVGLVWAMTRQDDARTEEAGELDQNRGRQQDAVKGDNKMGFALSRFAAFARGRNHARAMSGTPTLRRADAHPDAPARAPIFARRDLGTDIFDTLPTGERAFTVEPEPDQTPVVEATGLAMPRAPEPLPEDVLEKHLGARLTPHPAVVPTRPAAMDADLVHPAPVPTTGISIHELTERLERGLVRRASRSVAASPVAPQGAVLADIPMAQPVAVKAHVEPDIDEALRAALGTLRTIAVRQ